MNLYSRALLSFGLSISSSFAAIPPAEKIETYLAPAGDIGCSAMVEGFCDALWTPKNLGNLDLKIGKEKREIRLGRRPNQFGYELWNYLQARMQARTFLPKEFRAKLEKDQFFEKLARRLAKKPNHLLSREDLARDRALTSEIETIWENAIEALLFERMEPKRKDFFRLTNDNVAFKDWLAYHEIRDRLDAEINRALWERTPAWKQATADFEQIRTELISTIQEHGALALAVKDDWVARLRAVKIMIPGSDPALLNDLQRSCAKSASNAFYVPTENTITICGGYMKRVDLSRTIAHELSHALAVRRSVYKHAIAQPVALQLAELNSKACTTHLTCEQWGEWKKTYLDSVGQLRTMEIPNAPFLACFRKREIKSGAPEKEFLNYVTQNRVTDVIEYGAARSWFLQMVKEKELLRDGSEHANPRYLNPCGFSWSNPRWERLLNPQAVGSIFVHAYRCGSGEPAARLEAAISTAKELSLPLMEKELLLAGPFASDREFERHGYAEDIEEDFADYFSGEVFARILHKLPELADRRSLALASIAHLCDEPSLEKQFPDEAAAQKKFYFESHSEGIERRQRLLIAPLRKELACKRDFKPTIRECDWSGKERAPE